eukprot:Em0011g689a
MASILRNGRHSTLASFLGGRKSLYSCYNAARSSTADKAQHGQADHAASVCVTTADSRPPRGNHTSFPSASAPSARLKI